MITRRNDARGKPIGYLLVSHDVTAEQRYIEQQQFLAKVGVGLQASLDQQATIDCIASMVVGFIGDGCAIDLIDDKIQISRKRVVLAGPGQEILADALERIAPDHHHPLWSAVVGQQSLLFPETLFPETTSEFLRLVANEERHRQLLESVGVRSAMLIPLVARRRLTAVLTIVSCRPDRRYTADDLHLAEELARRASLALENARLYEVAQAALQGRDQVMGVVAHDLRNPLGTILMNTSLLRRRGEPERRSVRGVDAIERAATRMSRLIQDLLDVTRIEAGHLAIEPKRASAGQIVSEAVEAQLPLAACCCLGLELEVERELPDVWADHDRLLQIFENLVGNSIKFTREGGHIAVRAAQQGREVLFSVVDTGSGISAEDLPHVFERYWQGKDTRSHGAGLGLPIVKGIVEAHGGHIWVESTPGEGSAFCFTIPVAA
jgi:signal transduction histidine kinase